MTRFLPSRIASAAPRAYRRIARLESSLPGNHVRDADRRVVGVDHGDDRDAELGRLGDRDLVVADVDDEQRVGHAVHLLDAAQALRELLHLALQRERLALVHLLEGAVVAHRLEVLQPLDRALDRLEVGEHAAQPARVDVGHAAAPRFLGDDLARLPLGADEQDGALVRRQLADVLHRLLVELHRPLEVDDVDLVALAEDVLGHLRVPVPGLVAEVDPGFQHLTHGDGHGETPFRVEPRPAIRLATASRVAPERIRSRRAARAGTLKCAGLRIARSRPAGTPVDRTGIRGRIELTLNFNTFRAPLRARGRGGQRCLRGPRARRPALPFAHPSPARLPGHPCPTRPCRRSPTTPRADRRPRQRGRLRPHAAGGPRHRRRRRGDVPAGPAVERRRRPRRRRLPVHELQLARRPDARQFRALARRTGRGRRLSRAAAGGHRARRCGSASRCSCCARR